MENLIGQTVWIAKYALTKGIFTGVVKDTKDYSLTTGAYLSPSGILVTIKNDSNCYCKDYWLNKDVFLTEDEAKARAKILRDEEIKAVEEQLTKQLTKLKSLEF